MVGLTLVYVVAAEAAKKRFYARVEGANHPKSRFRR
jgi:hypothetical protein